MDKYGIIGFPLGHTFSPQIHNPAFKTLNIDAIYEKLPINPDSFNNDILKLKTGNYNGFNVTVPFKQRIIPFIDQIDPLAQKINAVNTILKKDGTWLGFNTDIYGFGEPITKYLPSIKSALVVGAGGTSRAVCFFLMENNLKTLTIINRNIEKAQNLKNVLEDEYKKEITVYPLNHEIDNKFDIIIKFLIVIIIDDIISS